MAFDKLKNWAVNTLDPIHTKRFINHQYDEFFNDETYARCITEELTADEINQIDEFFNVHYGRTVDPRWHLVFKNYSHKFDPKFFPSNLYAPKLAHFINPRVYVEMLSDKNLLPVIARAAGVKHLETYVSSTRDVLRDSDFNIISRSKALDILQNAGEFFVKPTVDTGAGTDCRAYSKDSGCDEITPEVVDSIFDYYGTDFVIQKLVKNNDNLNQLYPDALNTIRFVTYFIDGEIHHSLGCLRMGTSGSKLVNAGAGGMYVGVDNDGVLTDFALTDFSTDPIYEHPDTHAKFKGFKIEKYQEVVDAAKRLHSLVPQLGIIDWDFGIDDTDTPILIEANCRNGGGIEMIQYTHGKGAFGEDTGLLLEKIAELETLSEVDRRNNRVHL